jgi:hypothetical protein
MSISLNYLDSEKESRTTGRAKKAMSRRDVLGRHSWKREGFILFCFACSTISQALSSVLEHRDS